MLSLSSLPILLMLQLSLVQQDLTISYHECDGRCHLILPELMAAALEEYDPRFEAWSYKDADCSRLHGDGLVAPGDFDADGVVDVALVGRIDNTGVIVALESEWGAYRTHEIDRFPLTVVQDGEPVPYALVDTVEPGRVQHSCGTEPDTDPELILKRDAFAVSYHEKWGVIFYFSGEFLKFPLTTC